MELVGDVPRVDGQLAVARAFGDKSLKIHLSSDPDVRKETIDDTADFIVLASDGIWKVSYMSYILHSWFVELCVLISVYAMQLTGDV